MKRVFGVVPAALLLLCLPTCIQAQAQAQDPSQGQAQTAPAKAAGQDIPEWELFGGYSYLRANVKGTGPSFNMNGGTVSLSENMNRWFGGRFEFNAWGGTVAGTNVTAQTYTYGPVFSFRRFGHSTFFGEGQFGAIHASAGYVGISKSSNRFAMAYNGGVDYKMGKHMAIRFQGGYLMTRFLSIRQDNFEAAAGIVFYLGKK